MQRRNLRDRLDFDDYAILNHQICAKSHFDTGALVYHRDHLLPRNAQSTFL